MCTAMSMQLGVMIQNATLYKSLRNSEEFASSILKSMSTGILIADERGVIIRTNESACHILQVEMKSLVGLNLAEADSLVVTAAGIEGERRHGKSPAVSILERDAWETACTAAGADLPWTTRRANVFVEGLELAGTLGCRIRLGEVLLEVTEETEPCALMDRFHAGLRGALQPDWRGGASCRVLEPGTISVGDEVRFEDD